MSVAVGDAIEVKLPGGFAYGLVVLHPAAYPPAVAFLKGISPQPLADPIGALERDETITVLTPLGGEGSASVQILKRGLAVPETRFQVPVRDRRGRVIYTWEWNGQSISLNDTLETRRLPERRVYAQDALGELLKNS